MFIHCPRCNYLVATDPRTQAAPEFCTRCGGRMDAEVETPAEETSRAIGLLADADEATKPIDDITDISINETGTPPGTDVSPADVDASADASQETVPLSPVESIAIAPPQDNAAIDAATADSIAPDALTADAAVSSAGQIDDVPVLPRRAAKRMPAFARSRGTPGWRQRARWPWIALPVLIIVLAVQILLADRDRFAADAQWRPLVEGLCSAFRCTLPPWYEPTAFTMLDRDVRPLEGAAGVLQARATFRNDARWAQRWPILLLTLKDADGRTLGARAITPHDYLQDTNESELAPGQSAQIVVHVREPGTQVVAFSFDFR